jgi:hypothetical protein
MLYVLNRLKKSKMSEIGLKSVKSQKSDEITQNRDFRTDFAIVLK